MPLSVHFVLLLLRPMSKHPRENSVQFAEILEQFPGDVRLSLPWQHLKGNKLLLGIGRERKPLSEVKGG